MCDADGREQRALCTGTFPPMKQLKAARTARLAAVHRPRARCTPENILHYNVADVRPTLSFFMLEQTPAFPKCCRWFRKSRELNFISQSVSLLFHDTLKLRYVIVVAIRFILRGHVCGRMNVLNNLRHAVDRRSAASLANKIVRRQRNPGVWFLWEQHVAASRILFRRHIPACCVAMSEISPRSDNTS